MAVQFYRSIIKLFLLFGVLIGGESLATAQDTTHMSLALMPVQVVSVKGDVAKFRAVNWLNNGTQSGLSSLTIDSKVGKDTHVYIDAHSVPNNNDNNNELLIIKDDVGYVKLNYDTLRKYYPRIGGYYPYTTGTSLQVITLDRDLALDIDTFAFEVGNGTPQNSTLSLLYERDIKKGDKARLTWTAVAANVTKYTAPGWSEMDEVTDTITLRKKFNLLGFNVKGQQRYEFMDGTVKRYEQWYNTTMSVAASANKQRTQADDIQTKNLSTTLFADRWFLNDKTYTSLGYNFSHLRNTQIELLREYNVFGVPIGYSSRPRNKTGHALNYEDTHTWTGHTITSLTDNFSAAIKIKADIENVKGSSEMEYDVGNAGNTYTAAGNPDGIANYTYNGRNESKVTAAAEKLSLKYTGISKTSLYSDFELKQDRSRRSLDRVAGAGQSAVPGDDYYRDTRNSAPEWTGVLGVRMTPVEKVSAVVEYKQGKKDDKLTRLSVSSDSLAKLYTLRTNEEAISSRFSWKPFKWLENSFRAKMSGNTYQTQFADQGMLKTHYNERDFVYGIALLPTDAWMFNLNYSQQYQKISTPISGLMPTYNDFLPPSATLVSGLELSTSYAPTEKLSFFNVIGYSKAKSASNNNYNTASATTGALLFGADSEWYNAEFGAKLALKKNVTIEPHYAYYGSRTRESMDTGNYSAHVTWLDVNMKW